MIIELCKLFKCIIIPSVIHSNMLDGKKKKGEHGISMRSSLMLTGNPVRLCVPGPT